MTLQDLSVKCLTITRPDTLHSFVCEVKIIEDKNRIIPS